MRCGIERLVYFAVGYSIGWDFGSWKVLCVVSAGVELVAVVLWNWGCGGGIG